jgi:hypothetical protein
MNTRNSSLPILAFLAVLSAILAADYGRELAPLSPQASVVPFGSSGRAPAGLKEAA